MHLADTPQTTHRPLSRCSILVANASVADVADLEIECSEYWKGLPSKKLNGTGVHSVVDMLTVEDEETPVIRLDPSCGAEGSTTRPLAIKN